MTILTQTYQTIPIGSFRKTDRAEAVRRECGLLIHAAVINKRFREMLLANPKKSIETGYCGEKFSFTREEKERINAIRVKTLEEFAAQLLHVIDMPVVSEFPIFRQTDYHSLS